MVPGFIGGRNETGMLKQASAATESAAAADSGERHSPHSDPSSAMPLPPSDGGTAAPVVRLPIVLLVRLMGAAAASLVVSWVVGFRGGLALNSDNNDLIFNVHPVLMVIGFILLYGEGATCLIMGTTADLIYLRSYNRNAIMMAILTYKTLSGTKNFKKAVHLTIQFLALCSGFIGVWAALKFHNGKGIDNFYSLHSWLGLTCLLLFGIQWGIGFATFWYPGGTRNGRAFLLPWHVFFGLYIYALAVITATTGLLEKATFLQSSSIILRYSNEAFLINFLGILIVALGGFVVFAVITPGSVKPDAYTGIQE